jgi:hypothetical protein
VHTVLLCIVWCHVVVYVCMHVCVCVCVYALVFCALTINCLWFQRSLGVKRLWMPCWKTFARPHQKHRGQRHLTRSKSPKTTAKHTKNNRGSPCLGFWWTVVSPIATYSCRSKRMPSTPVWVRTSHLFSRYFPLFYSHTTHATSSTPTTHGIHCVCVGSPPLTHSRTVSPPHSTHNAPTPTHIHTHTHTHIHTHAHTHIHTHTHTHIHTHTHTHTHTYTARPDNIESTVMGAAYAAGVAVGVYPPPTVPLRPQATSDFLPHTRGELDRKQWLRGWEKAVDRSLGWNE